MGQQSGIKRASPDKATAGCHGHNPGGREALSGAAVSEVPGFAVFHPGCETVRSDPT
jgi:hypothetical protein